MGRRAYHYMLDVLNVASQWLPNFGESIGHLEVASQSESLVKQIRLIQDHVESHVASPGFLFIKAFDTAMSRHSCIR